MAIWTQIYFQNIIGIEVLGLIGVDMLNHFDILFDIPTGKIIFSKEEIPFQGDTLGFSRPSHFIRIYILIGRMKCSTVSPLWEK